MRLIYLLLEIKHLTGTLPGGIGQFFNNIGDRIPSTPQYQRYTPGYPIMETYIQISLMILL
jgi:hypothetical protein